MIWDKGIGSTVSIGSTGELDKNKVEVLREFAVCSSSGSSILQTAIMPHCAKTIIGFLMILLSSTIYTSPHALHSTSNTPLGRLTHSTERRLVLSLLCSLLNTSLAAPKSNTVGQLPYSHLISKAAEEKRTLVRSCLMTLLVALDYQEPAVGEGEMGGDRDDNAFRFFLSKLVCLHAQ